MVNNNDDDDDDNDDDNDDDDDDLPHKLKPPLFSVFPACSACLSEIASHRNTHHDLCSHILRQPIYSPVQYADGAEVNTFLQGEPSGQC